MQSLTIDPPLPFLVRPGPVGVALIGCGGTGSHLAYALARLAVHAQAEGMDLSLLFIDGDTVDAANVGRQLFSPAEIGRNKAETLAERLNAALGLAIGSVAQMADRVVLRDCARTWRDSTIRILVGAVDTVGARAELAAALQLGSWDLWLDCGNHEFAGQVVLGSTAHQTALQRALALPGVCAALPSPAMQLPGLVAALPAAPATLDCAAAQIANAQSLMVNQLMAAIASQYCYDLIIRRRIEIMATAIDCRTLTMRSTPITAQTLAPFLPPLPPGITAADFLAGTRAWHEDDVDDDPDDDGATDPTDPFGVLEAEEEDEGVEDDDELIPA